jgi:hypothetical protein
MSDVARSCRLHLNVPEQAETPRRESQHSVFCIVHSISNRLLDKGRSRVFIKHKVDTPFQCCHARTGVGHVGVEMHAFNLINMEISGFCFEVMVGVADISRWNKRVFISLYMHVYQKLTENGSEY